MASYGYMVWAIVVAVIILLFAVFLFEMGARIFEDNRMFLIAIGAFFVLFIGAIILLKVYMPKLSENTDVGMVTQTILPMME